MSHSRYYQSRNEGVDIAEDLIIPIREKFYDFFLIFYAYLCHAIDDFA
jgi:hypothetical protein